MGRWVRTIGIDHLITTDTTSGGIIKASEALIDLLTKEGAPMRLIAKAKAEALEDPEAALALFNSGLNRIYDWADENRIWVRA